MKNTEKEYNIKKRNTLKDVEQIIKIANMNDSNDTGAAITSIENKISIDDENDKPKYEKGDVFTKRTIRKSKVINSAENVKRYLKRSEKDD